MCMYKLTFSCNFLNYLIIQVNKNIFIETIFYSFKKKKFNLILNLLQKTFYITNNF